MQRNSTGVCAMDNLLKQKSRQMDSRFDPHMILPVVACNWIDQRTHCWGLWRFRRLAMTDIGRP